MGRKQKNNAEFFPHFSTMRNDKKVKVLRNKFGAVLGYAFWSMFLEWLTEQDGLEWEFSDIECEMFASELGVSATEIREMVDFCLKLELLARTPSNFVYSERLHENLKPLFDKRNRERSRSKQRERRENGTFEPQKSTDPGISATVIPHSIVEESKEEDIYIPVSVVEPVPAAPVVEPPKPKKPSAKDIYQAEIDLQLEKLELGQIEIWNKFYYWYVNDSNIDQVRKLEKQPLPNQIVPLLEKFGAGEVVQTIRDMGNYRKIKDKISVGLTLHNWLSRNN